jgi:hypothetical protein
MSYFDPIQHVIDWQLRCRWFSFISEDRLLNDEKQRQERLAQGKQYVSVHESRDFWKQKSDLESMILGAIDAKDRIIKLKRDNRIRYLLRHGYTQEIVGEMEGLSQQRISQIR